MLAAEASGSLPGAAESAEATTPVLAPIPVVSVVAASEAIPSGPPSLFPPWRRNITTHFIYSRISIETCRLVIATTRVASLYV